jgi:hypothetical protein
MRRPSLESFSLSSVAAALLLLPVASACGKAEAPAAAVTRTDSAGVEIVTNPRRDRFLGWSLDSILDIRSPTGTGADTVGFFNVTDIAVTGAHIVILDRSQPALVVYDTLGHVQGRYGRRGKGPGEFEHPISVAVAPGGGVGVFDLSHIELFDASFAPSGSISLLGVPVLGVSMRFVDDVPVLPTWRRSADTAVFGLDALGRTDTTVIATLPQVRNTKPISFKSCGLWIPSGFMPVALAPTLRWTPDRRGHVLLAKGDRYDIGVYGGSHFTLERVIRRDQTPIHATKALAARIVGKGPTGCDPAEVVEKGGFAPTVPPLGEMRVAPDGDIWVHRWAPQGDSLIDVFDSTGVYRGTLRDQPMPVAFLGDDRVVVKRTDALDVAFLTIYRVVR